MKKTPASYVVKRSRAGLGLFANTSFKRGDFIIEYTGERISHEEADRRGGRYLFILSKKVVLDGRRHEHTARYINHACKPNAEAVIDEEKDEVHIIARKKILPGEEITYDYGKDYWNEYIKKHQCRCATCSPVVKV